MLHLSSLHSQAYVLVTVCTPLSEALRSVTGILVLCRLSPIYLSIGSFLLASVQQSSQKCVRELCSAASQTAVQEPIYRVLNSEHLYKRLLAELLRENSSWGLSFRVSVLPPPLLDLGFPGPSCPPVGLAVNSGQHWVRLRGKGRPNSGG